MVNINSVRETVLAILNKEERGYLAPSAFNRFAKQAQLEIFESYFQDLQHFSVSAKGQIENAGYSDAVENLMEKIDVFSEYSNSINSISETMNSTESFTGSTGTVSFNLPRDANSIVSVTVAGTATTNFSFTAPRTITFNAQTDAPNGAAIIVTYVGSTNTFVLPTNHYRLDSVFHRGTGADSTLRAVTQINKENIAYVLGSPLRAPSVVFPKYQRIDDNLNVLPASITSGIEIHYIRRPSDPIWGSDRLGTSRTPIYNSERSTNFELHPADEYKLVENILLYAGVQLKQQDIIQFAGADLAADNINAKQ